MADLIPNFDEITLPGTTNGSSKNAKVEKEPTLFWLNVGVERNGKLVQLPMGIALDKLEARKIPGANTKNVEFRQLRQAEAQLWNQVRNLMSKMQPGQSIKLPFTVEIRRIEDAETTEEVESSENPFSVGNLGL